MELFDKLHSKGVDTIAVVAVNDAFVMAYWADKLKATEKVTMLADGNGDFTKLIGMECDMSFKGMGLRSKRYAMLVKDGVVKYVGIDESGLERSAASAILKFLSSH